MEYHCFVSLYKKTTTSELSLHIYKYWKILTKINKYIELFLSFPLLSKSVPDFLSPGGGGAGHQRSLSEVSQEAQRHDELFVQHAQRWCKMIINRSVTIF